MAGVVVLGGSKEGKSKFGGLMGADKEKPTEGPVEEEETEEKMDVKGAMKEEAIDAIAEALGLDDTKKAALASGLEAYMSACK